MGELNQPKSPAQLFRVFTHLALQGFGGVLAVAQRELVERQRWLTTAQFVEYLSVGQILPGPNIVNLSLMIGDRFFGWRGALAALSGMLAVPMVIVIALAALYSAWASNPIVAGALHGMGAVAAGLTASMGLKMIPALLRNPMGRTLCAAYAVAAFVAVGVMRWPLLWVVLSISSLGFATAWWVSRPRLAA